MVARQVAALPMARGQERRESCPQLFGQHGRAGYPHRRRDPGRYIATRTAGGVTPLGRGLVRAPPVRPAQAVPLLLRRVGNHVQ